MSEQDNFFDEEPDAPSPAPKGSKSPATAPSKSPAEAPAPAVYDDAPAEGSTTWAIASLIGVIGLLLGAILGFVLGSTLSAAAVSTDTTAPAPITGTQSAPQLTTDQISAGELPAGHPSVGTTGSTGTSTTK